MTMKFETQRKFLFIILVLFILAGCDGHSPVSIPADKQAQHGDDAQKIYLAFQNHQSGLFVESKGRVIKILSDDEKGDRHQRFIVQLPQG